MSWLKKIQSQPERKKIRIVWIITAVCFAALVVSWILIGNYSFKAVKDTSFFDTISQGIKNFKEKKP